MLDKIAAVELAIYFKDVSDIDGSSVELELISVEDVALNYVLVYCPVNTYISDVFTVETIAYAYCLLIGAIK